MIAKGLVGEGNFSLQKGGIQQYAFQSFCTPVHQPGFHPRNAVNTAIANPRTLLFWYRICAICLELFNGYQYENLADRDSNPKCCIFKFLNPYYPDDDPGYGHRTNIKGMD